MAGWSITVFNTTPEGCDALLGKSNEEHRAAIVASWEAGTGGLDWLDELVKQGKARYLRGDWYPSIYPVRAKDLRALSLWEEVRLHQEHDRTDAARAGLSDRRSKSRPGQMRIQHFHPHHFEEAGPEAIWTVEIWGLA